jgi:cobalt-precorrin-5B (C1)-methyltransferase
VAGQAYNLNLLADNGLRRGYTTGTCATAAVKAALLLLETGQVEETVLVNLPDGKHFLEIEIDSVERLDSDCAVARVIKHAGDDPDRTNRAVIWAQVRKNDSQVVRFFAGEGVGIVTLPGIRVAQGEPAINPVPRQMMNQAIEEVLDGLENPGFDLTIGCQNGEEIAKRTFNQRLGIVGGISILGTSGIVEPMSLDAYKASIEVYIRVALGDQASSVAFMPGNIGLSFARQKLNLERGQIVTVANFLGFSLDCLLRELDQADRFLDELWVLGHPGKLAKILDDIWETHSGKSHMAMNVVARAARDVGIESLVATEIEHCPTVEAVVELLSHQPLGRKVWQFIERCGSALIADRTKRVRRAYLRLFSMNGTALGDAYV